MAPIHIDPTAIVKRQAGKVTHYLRARAQHEYNEASLQIETKLRQSKAYLAGSMSVQLYTDIGKAFSSYKTWRIKRAALPVQTQAGANDRGRIKKVTTPSTDPYAGWLRPSSAERQRANMQRMACYRDAPVRAARCTEQATFEQERAYPEKSPKAHCTIFEPEHELSYMESVRVLHPPSDDPAERTKCILASLASIPSINRISGVGAPSGHSGISDDPILAKYNQERYTNNVLELHRQYQSMQQSKREEEQRQAAAAEAERQRKLNVLQHYCGKYDERVAKLVQFGPKFNAEITKLGDAFERGDLFTLCQAITAFVDEVVEPAYAILQEMPAEIALETSGAAKLKDAWPLEKMDQVLERFTAPNLSVFSDEVQNMIGYMMQGFRAVCTPILNAVPLVNPLGEPPTLPFSTKPVQVPFTHYMATAPAASQSAAQTHPQPSAPEGPNAGKNFASFADLINNKEAQVPNIQIASPSFDGSGPFGTASISSTPAGDPSSRGSTSAPSNDNKVQVIKQAIDAKVLDFEENVTKLVVEGSVKVTPRKAILEDLEWLDTYAQGETGLLGPNDCCGMKNEIDRVTRRIANLRDGKEKNKTTTRELEVLAHRVLKLWT